MPRTSQLVLAYLEKAPAKLWRSNPEVLRRHIGGRAGIYALYRGDRLLYVGLAKYLTVRLMQHLINGLGGQWNRFSVYVTVKDEHIKELESLVLRIASPAGNTATPSLARSEDLGPKILAEAKGLSASEPRPDGRKRSGGPTGVRRALQGRRRERIYRATLRPDGTISYARQVHTSPSGAAAAALGRACDGWTFWKFRDDSGEWVPLRNLRP